MRSIRRGRRRFRPELDKPDYLAANHGEERDRPVGSHAVADGYIRDRLRFVANEAIDSETPGPVRGIFMIHARKAFGTSNALFGLRPLEHEIVLASTVATEWKSFVAMSRQN